MLNTRRGEAMDVKAVVALPALALIVLASCMPAYAQINAKMLATEQGTLDVDFALDPDLVSAGEEARMNIDFVNPSTVRIQEHIDYHVTVSAVGGGGDGGGGAAVKSVPLTHTSSGSVSIPVEFESDGLHTVLIGIRGILFQPIPLETVEFDVIVGGAGATAEEEEEVKDEAGAGATAEEEVEDEAGAGATAEEEVEDRTSEAGGGCLIATAAYGTETAGQVQLLREVRDGAVMGTQAGATFMSSFSHVYYAFSPAVADLERQSPALKEAVRVGITPMLATLSLLDGAGIDSDGEAVAYGLAVILINAGMYAGIPIVAVLAVRGSVRARRLRA